MLYQAIYLLAIFSLAQSSVLIKFSGIPPVTLGFWRLTGACVILVLVRLINSPPMDILRRIAASWRWVSYTGLFFFLHLWSYSYSAQTTSIANCMILFSLNPLFTALGARLFFKEQIEKSVVLSYLFAFVGLYFLLHDKMALNNESWMGETSALVSGLLYSIYALLSKRGRIQTNNWDFGIGVYFVCGVCFLIATLVMRTPLTGYGDNSWLALFGIIIIPTLLGHSLFTYLLNYLNINWMSCGKLLEPTIATAIAFFVFKEAIGIYTILAFTSTSMAVLLLFFKIENRGGIKFTILLRKNPLRPSNQHGIKPAR